MKFSRNRTSKIVAFVSAACFAALVLFTPILFNLWSLATDGGFLGSSGGFFIPEESSVFTFDVTEMNHGSGDWWIYAEDHRYFYAAINWDGVAYVAFPKSKVSQCASFEPRDSSTWCKEILITHNSK